MRTPAFRMLTLSLFAINLLFFSFVHGLLRIQFIKQSLDVEYSEMQRYEALKLETGYEDILREADMSRELMLSDYYSQSRMRVLEILAMEAAFPGVEGQKPFLELLKGLNGSGGSYIWVFDSSGALLCAPGVEAGYYGIPSASPYRRQLADAAEGPLTYAEERQNPLDRGYGGRLKGTGWTVLVFQDQEAAARQLDGIERLKSERISRLIRDLGQGGAAIIIDENMKIKDYTYSQMVGRPIDDIQLVGRKPPSELLFTRENKAVKYVLYDPVSNRTKYREAYVRYNPQNGYHYLVTRNQNELFAELNLKSASSLRYMGIAGIALILINGVFLIRQYFDRREEGTP